MVSLVECVGMHGVMVQRKCWHWCGRGVWEALNLGHVATFSFPTKVESWAHGDVFLGCYLPAMPGLGT